MRLELIYNWLNSYKTSSSQVRVEVVPCKTGYYYSADSRTCECVTSNSIICNSTSVCIQKGYWYDNASKIKIPCPTRNCGYSNGQCPPPTGQCPTSPGYCNITGPDDVCQEGRGQYLCSELCLQLWSFPLCTRLYLQTTKYRLHNVWSRGLLASFHSGAFSRPHTSASGGVRVHIWFGVLFQRGDFIHQHLH